MEPDAAPQPVLDGFDDLLAANVLIVTGKGGVGKTTAAAVLGLCGAASGRRTLLVEVEGRQSLSRAFDVAPWDYREQEFRPGLLGAALDPHDAVREYLELFYGLKGLHRLMGRAHALDFVTTAAPGLDDLLLIGKVYELEARRRADGRRAYDLIVVDAPPTGRIVPFLGSPEAVTEIVRVGPIRRQAGQISEMLLDPRRVRAVVVTLLEEGPVRETADAVAALADAGVAPGPIVANQLATPALDAPGVHSLASLGPEGVRDVAGRLGARMSRRTAELALELARDHAARRRLQRELHGTLARDTGLPVVGLPLRAGLAFDVRDLEALADVVAVQVGEEPAHGPDADQPELSRLGLPIAGPA